MLTNQCLGPGEQSFAFFRQLQRVRAAVGCRGNTDHQTSFLQTIQQRNHAGAENAQSVSELHLRKAGILANHREHRVLRGVNIQRCQRLNEIIEDPQLGPPD